jgi:hypothetical protein
MSFGFQSAITDVTESCISDLTQTLWQIAPQTHPQKLYKPEQSHRRPMTLTKDRPTLSSERAPSPRQDRNCQTVTKIWSWASDGARHQDRRTDWPSVVKWLGLGLGEGPYKGHTQLVGTNAWRGHGSAEDIWKQQIPKIMVHLYNDSKHIHYTGGTW